MASAKDLHLAGIAQFRSGNMDGALSKLQEALPLAPENSRQQAEIYNDLGVVYRELEDYDAAFTSLDEAMAIFNQLEDAKGQAQTLGNLGALLEAEEDYETAVNSYKQSAKIFEELGESEMAMYVWQAISRLRTRQGKYIAALGAYEEGVQNMPKGFKRSALEKILKAPGKLLGGASQLPPIEEDDDEGDSK
jgi:tetratricopeptide (TPR) repeat protein